MGTYDQPPRSPDYDAYVESAKKENARLGRAGGTGNVPVNSGPSDADSQSHKQAMWKEQDERWAKDDEEHAKGEPARKALRVVLDAVAVAEPQPAVILTCASTIKPEPIAWIWPGYLAGGKLHILAGVAGTGKTTIALALAATLTSCGKWPDGTICRTARDVIIWSGEDDPADTIVPRLLAMGADLAHIHIITGSVGEDGKPCEFDPATEIPKLAETLKQYPNTGMLILDPISSTVSGDSHQNTVVRRSLQPVVDLAAKVRCAVVGITHFTKGTAGKDPLERVTGSLAFGAFARLVMVTVKPAKGAEQLHRLIRTKSNIGPDGGGFEYSLTQTNVPGHIDLYASCVLWGEALKGTAGQLADEIEGEGHDDKGPSPREEATGFLLGILADGPRMQRDIEELAAQEGISKATMRRAKVDLGVTSQKMAHGWQWTLKNWVQGAQRAQGAHVFSGTISEHVEHVEQDPHPQDDLHPLTEHVEHLDVKSLHESIQIQSLTKNYQGAQQGAHIPEDEHLANGLPDDDTTTNGEV